MRTLPKRSGWECRGILISSSVVQEFRRLSLVPAGAEGEEWKEFRLAKQTGGKEKPRHNLIRHTGDRLLPFSNVPIGTEWYNGFILVGFMAILLGTARLLLFFSTRPSKD